MPATPKKANTRNKIRQVQEAFKVLYQVERIRYDDTIEILAERFFTVPRMIEEYLRHDLPEEEQLSILFDPKNDTPEQIKRKEKIRKRAMLALANL